MKSFEAGTLERDIDRIRHVSGMVKKRILESNPKYEQKIKRLTNEELEDLDHILGLAEHLLIKHHQKKETCVLFKEFVDMIKDWSCSFAEINNDVQELMVSAQYSVSEIKTAQSDVASNLSFGEREKQQSQAADVGTINLTKSVTPVYTQEYQQNHQAQCEQVI